MNIKKIDNVNPFKISVPLAIKIKDPELLKLLQHGNAEELIGNYQTFKAASLELIFDFWRLTKIINKSGNANADISDAVERFGDTLKKQGIEVKDMTGSAFNEGLVVDVIHVDKTNDENIKNAFISETIRPAIYLNGQLIQKSEVVVTKPSGGN